MSHHLVILKRTYLDRILRGRKTAECRLSRAKRPPFGAVSPGDTLWLKQSGALVAAKAIAGQVTFIHPLPREELADLQLRYAHALQADASFFAGHRDARYATLIQLVHVHRITPLTVRKPDRRAWVVLPGPLA